MRQTILTHLTKQKTKNGPKFLLPKQQTQIYTGRHVPKGLCPMATIYSVNIHHNTKTCN